MDDCSPHARLVRIEIGASGAQQIELLCFGALASTAKQISFSSAHPGNPEKRTAPPHIENILRTTLRIFAGASRRLAVGQDKSNFAVLVAGQWWRL